MKDGVLDTETIELNLLLEGIWLKYGYDLRSYSRASVKRRLQQCLCAAGMDRFSELLPRVLHDEAFFDSMLKNLSVTVTEMFRDPSFFRDIREHVVKALRTYPSLKIWHAGCATGEEAYSMAILLKEEGLLNRTRLYATDFNKQSLDVAKSGIYSLEHLQQYTSNYVAAGGAGAFSDYYRARYGSAKMDSSLTKRITFSPHNLVTDGVFGEMQMVVCRNVLIYFDRPLQNRVLQLFSDSLCRGGFLGLGSKESIDSDAGRIFEPIVRREKIFKKGLSTRLAAITDPAVPGMPPRMTR